MSMPGRFLPDHMHCVWTLPVGDADSPRVGRRSRPSFPGRCPRPKPGSATMEPPWRARHLAAALLGAHDPRRAGLCRPCGLHAFQPGEARPRAASGGLVVFVISPLRGRRGVSSGLGRGRSRAARCRGATVMRGGGMNSPLRVSRVGRKSFRRLPRTSFTSWPNPRNSGVGGGASRWPTKRNNHPALAPGALGAAAPVAALHRRACGCPGLDYRRMRFFVPGHPQARR